MKWDFLFPTSDCMNFDSKWIHWLKSILKSTRIYILINGSPSDEISPERGLRQGNHLSPLIFNLLGEVLFKLLNKAASESVFEGILIPGCSSPITHLQYADNVILFIKNDLHSVTGIKRILKCFELLSGLGNVKVDSTTSNTVKLLDEWLATHQTLEV